MRADMSEVVIERPRSGWRVDRYGPRWRWRGDEGEESPLRERLCPRGKTKHFSDLLGPLRRFLHGSVGRPWNAVYRELRRALSPRSYLHQHILLHVGHMVQTEVARDASGQVVSLRGTPVTGLYVCPESGRLQKIMGGWAQLEDHDGPVRLQTFLNRRLGHRWEAVEQACAAAGMLGSAASRLERIVTLHAEIRQERGRTRVYERVRGPTPGLPGEAGTTGVWQRLNRGRFFVADGVLGRVR